MNQSGVDLTAILDRSIDRHRLVGVSAAVASGGRIVWSGEAGSAEAGSLRPMPAKPVLRIASVTKLFTASAVMLLRDRGALSLEDAVHDHVPELAVEDVTIGEFLCHGSGLQRETPDDPGWQTGGFLTGDAFLAALARARAVLPRMTRWKYSNLAYNILGSVIERAAGAPFGEFVRRELIASMELSSTTVGRPDEEDRLVPGHQRVPGTYGMSTDASWRDPVPEPAGGVWSSAEDVARLGLCLVGALRGPLGPETTAEMRRPRMMVDEGWHLAHGLGPMLLRHGDEVLVGHAGDVAGFSGWVLAAPGRGVSAACLANVMDAGELLPIVLDLLHEAPLGDGFDDTEARLRADERPVGMFAADGSVMALSSVGEAMVARWPSADGPLSPGSVRLLPVGPDRYVFVDGGPFVGEELVLERDLTGEIVASGACGYRFERIHPVGEP